MDELAPARKPGAPEGNQNAAKGKENKVANGHIDSAKGSKASKKASHSPERVIARLKRDKDDPEHPDREKAGFLLAGIERGEVKPHGAAKATQEQIAEKVGVSRRRVGQIVTEIKGSEKEANQTPKLRKHGGKREKQADNYNLDPRKREPIDGDPQRWLMLPTFTPKLLPRNDWAKQGYVSINSPRGQAAIAAYAGMKEAS